MTKEQLDALKEYIEATIQSKVYDILHRDGLQESIRELETERKLHEAFGLGRP